MAGSSGLCCRSNLRVKRCPVCDDAWERCRYPKEKLTVGEINKVTVRFRDGRVLKGMTQDFVPGKPSFHLHVHDSKEIEEIRTEELKAVFFVKDFGGRPDYEEIRNFPANPPASKGRKIAVLFTDGELLTGYTLGYDPTRPGFFILPTDEMSNNERAYVVRSAAKEIGLGLRADQVLAKTRLK